MKNRRLWSFMFVIVMLFTTVFSTGGAVKAESGGAKGLKINQTTLSFQEIVYVDGTNGNDSTGDGSKENPFATMLKGFDYLNENCREGGAIVVKKGTYNIGNLFAAGDNLNTKYNEMKLSIIADELGSVTFTGRMEWNMTENGPDFKSQISFYGIIMDTSHIHMNGDKWIKEYYNCVLQNYGGDSSLVDKSEVYVENSIFRGSYSDCYTYKTAGTAVNCATTSDYLEPNNGTVEHSLYNVTIDSDFNITSDGWENAGKGKNPDGSQAHIGVYGGQFAWGSKVEETDVNELDIVMEVNEKLLLSVDKYLSENINMIWTSTDETVAAVDEDGVVTALKPGEAKITAKSKNGKYTDTISILVVEDAEDYRLAVDLNIGESCRATIDKNKHTAYVEWSVADESVATVSSKGKITAQGKGLTIVTATGESGKVIGQVYVRVR